MANLKAGKLTDFMFPIDENLAEFFGIMFGDGKLTIDGHKTGYRVQIWLDAKTEQEYSEYVRDLCIKLFNVEPAVCLEHNSSVICVRFHAKQTILALHRLGIPLNHEGEMIVPGWIITNAPFSAAFLRGLFDTDGGVVFQRDRGYVYRLIKITMKNLNFAETVKNMLLKLGFHPYICKHGGMYSGYEVVLRKLLDQQLWKNNIGTSNQKNLEKLEGRPLVAARKWERRDLNPKLVGWSHS